SDAAPAASAVARVAPDLTETSVLSAAAQSVSRAAATPALSAAAGPAPGPAAVEPTTTDEACPAEASRVGTRGATDVPPHAVDQGADNCAGGSDDHKAMDSGDGGADPAPNLTVDAKAAPVQVQAVIVAAPVHAAATNEAEASADDDAANGGAPIA